MIRALLTTRFAHENSPQGASSIMYSMHSQSRPPRIGLHVDCPCCFGGLLDAAHPHPLGSSPQSSITTGHQSPFWTSCMTMETARVAP